MDGRTPSLQRTTTGRGTRMISSVRGLQTRHSALKLSRDAHCLNNGHHQREFQAISALRLWRSASESPAIYVRQWLRDLTCSPVAVEADTGGEGARV